MADSSPPDSPIDENRSPPVRAAVSRGSSVASSVSSISVPNAASPPPLPSSQKDVVIMCMTIEEFRWDNATHDKWSFNQRMYRFTCNHCGSYTVEQPTTRGYQNPFNHLKSKTCCGSEAGLCEFYWDCKNEYDANLSEQARRDESTDPNRKRNHQQILPSSSLCYNEEVNALHKWLTLIIFFGVSFSAINDPKMRAVLNNPAIKTIKIVKDTMLYLVRIVERKIAARMKTTPGGQILFDGWTSNSQHYVAIWVSYIWNVNDSKKVHELRLIACGPPPPIEAKDDSHQHFRRAIARHIMHDEDEEAVEFNAEVHLNYFESIAEIYGVDPKKWFLCQAADNAEVNKRIAKLSHGLHVPCPNHKLALAANTLTENDDGLARIADRISHCSSHIRGSMKVAANIRNQAAKDDWRRANLSAKTESDTRKWLGMAGQFKGHLNMSSYIADSAKKKIARMREFEDTVSSGFLDDVNMHLAYLNPLLKASTALQKPMVQLSKTQEILDYVKSCVDGKSGPFAACNMNTDQLAAEYHATNPDFITGICKVQRGVAHELTLTHREKEALKPFLLKPEASVDTEEQDSDDEGEFDFLAGLKKFKTENLSNVEGKSAYIDCSFVVASTACVEGGWSEADHLVCNKRRSCLAPIMLEAMLFLKKNKDLWGIKDVYSANMARLGSLKDVDKDEDLIQKRISEVEAFMEDQEWW